VISAKVRVIDEEGKQLGVLGSWEALKIAQERGFDLVEVSPQAVPPVCKLLDYGKYLYEEKRKDKENKRAQRESQSALKEIQLSPVIQENDLNVKIKNIQRLLDDGNKVKVMIKFSGRQIKHSELAKVLFEKVLAKLPEKVNIEKSPNWEGRSLQMIIAIPNHNI
jgi:translation initiation factor IF-3